MQKKYGLNKVAELTGVHFNTLKDRANGTCHIAATGNKSTAFVLTDLEKALKGDEAQIQKVKAELQDFEGFTYDDTVAMQEEIKKLQSEYKYIKRSESELKQLVKQVRGEISQLQDGNIRLKLERDNAQQDLQKLEKDYELLQRDSGELKGAKEELKNHVEEVKRLKAVLVKKEVSYDEKCLSVANLENKVKELRLEAVDLENWLKEKDAELRSNEATLRDLSDRYDKLQSEADEYIGDLMDDKEKIEELEQLLQTEVPKQEAKKWWAWVTYCCMTVMIVSMFSVFGFATIQSIAFAIVGSALFIIAGLASMKFLQTKEMGDWHTGIKCFVFFMALCEIYIHYLSFSSYLDAAVVGSVSVFAAVAAAWVAVMNLIGITIQNKE